MTWTRGAEKQIELIKRARSAREIRGLEDAKAVASQLEGLHVRMRRRAGGSGRLLRLGRPGGHRRGRARGRRPRARPARIRSVTRSRPSARTRCGSGCTPRSVPPSTSRSRPAEQLRAGPCANGARASLGLSQCRLPPGTPAYLDASRASSGSISRTIAQTAAIRAARAAESALLRSASSWSMASATRRRADSSIEHTVEDYQVDGACGRAYESLVIHSPPVMPVEKRCGSSAGKSA